MGRSKRDFPKGKFVLRKIGSKYILYYYYFWDGQQLRKSTDVMLLTEKDFNNAEACHGCAPLKKTYPNYIAHNRRLVNRLQEIDGMILDHMAKNGNRIDAKTIQKFMEGDDTANRGIDFFDFAEERLSRKESLAGPGSEPSTINNHRANIRQFKNFIESQHRGSHVSRNELLYISDMTEDIVREYCVWKSKTNVKLDTINRCVKSIATICKDAADMGYLSSKEAKAISEVQISTKKNLFKYEEAECSIKYLSTEEIAKLVDYGRKAKDQKTIDILEMYLLSFFACGIRFIDILTLRWADIDYDSYEIHKVQYKTRNIVKSPLNKYALNILEHWKGRNSTYVFNMLPERFELCDNTKDIIYKTRSAKSHSVNKYLKRIMQEIGIKQPLTFHSARHSWAMYAMESGIPIHVISQNLGHTSTLTTERYYAKASPSKVKLETTKLDFSFLDNKLTTLPNSQIVA